MIQCHEYIVPMSPSCYMYVILTWSAIWPCVCIIYGETWPVFLRCGSCGISMKLLPQYSLMPAGTNTRWVTARDGLKLHAPSSAIARDTWSPSSQEMETVQARLDELFSRHRPPEWKSWCCPGRHTTDCDRQGGMSSVFHILWVTPRWQWRQGRVSPSQVWEILPATQEYPLRKIPMHTRVWIDVRLVPDGVAHESAEMWLSVNHSRWNTLGPTHIREPKTRERLLREKEREISASRKLQSGQDALSANEDDAILGLLWMPMTRKNNQRKVTGAQIRHKAMLRCWDCGRRHDLQR